MEATSVRRPARGVRAERVRLGVVKRGERAGSDVRHRAPYKGGVVEGFAGEGRYSTRFF